jgi:hypothetical protein
VRGLVVVVGMILPLRPTPVRRSYTSLNATHDLLGPLRAVPLLPRVINVSAAVSPAAKTLRPCVQWPRRTVVQVQCGIQARVAASRRPLIVPRDRGKTRLPRSASRVHRERLARRVDIPRKRMRVQSALLESMRQHQDKLVHALIALRGVPQHRKALRVAWGRRYRDGWPVQLEVSLVRQYARTIFVRIR